VLCLLDVANDLAPRLLFYISLWHSGQMSNQHGASQLGSRHRLGLLVSLLANITHTSRSSYIYSTCYLCYHGCIFLQQ
jgi:hypothetical protein